MKKILFSVKLFLIVILSFTFFSCDGLDTLPLNFPISFDFELQGAGITDTDTFCLSESETYTEYRQDIKNLKFLRMIFRTDPAANSVNPENLEVTMEIVIKRLDTGQILYYEVLENFKPINYKKPNIPLELNFTQEQLAAINDHLNNSSDPCFESTVTLLAVSQATLNNYIKAKVDILIEAEIEL